MTDRPLVLTDIDFPRGIERLSNLDMLQGKPIPKIDRLRIMSDSQFEDFILEWAHGYLKDQKREYKKVVKLGGAGDKGRDIICFIDDAGSVCDYYQCKHYAAALTPGDVLVEIGKLSFLVFDKQISYPQKYYFVSPHGVGPKLHDLLQDSTKLKEELYTRWDKLCENHIRSEKTPLTNELRGFIDKLDFSIFDGYTPLTLIDEHSKTKFHAARFGGGLNKSRGIIPSASSEISNNELTYTNQLFEVYTEKTGSEIKNKDELLVHDDLKEHFDESRNSFYSAESLKEFSRDIISTTDEDCFDELKEEVYTTIKSVLRKDGDTGFNRLLDSTHAAVSGQYTSSPLHIEIKAQDKEGLCHHLANETRVKWVKK